MSETLQKMSETSATIKDVRLAHVYIEKQCKISTVECRNRPFQHKIVSWEHSTNILTAADSITHGCRE